MTPINATITLCDHAEAINGKLYIHGGGWTTIYGVGQPFNIALAMLIEVEADRRAKVYGLRVDLLDADGAVVSAEGNPLSVQGQLEVNPPRDARASLPVPTPLVMTFGSMRLPAGRYTWRLSVGGEAVADRTFQVLAPPGAGPRLQRRPGA